MLAVHQDRSKTVGLLTTKGRERKTETTSSGAQRIEKINPEKWVVMGGIELK